MIEPPIPSNEKSRIKALEKLNYKTIPNKKFDKITRIATQVFNIPISTVTMVNSKMEHHISVCGLEEKHGKKAVSFCGHAIAGKKNFMEVPDTLKDSRFKDNPMVIKNPKIRFYAATILKSPDGYNIGTFCLKDNKPKKLTIFEKKLLKDFGEWIEMELNYPDLIILRNEINETKEKLRDVVENIDSAFWLTDVKNNEKIIYVSPAFETIWGNKREELYKNPRLWTSCIIDEDKEKVEKKFIGFLKGKNDFNIEYRIRSKDGKIKWIHDHGNYVFLKNKKQKRIVGSARDITIRKENELKLHNVNKKLKEFDSLAAHELKTPVNIVINKGREILEKDVNAMDKNLKSKILLIIDNAERAKKTINQILALAKTEIKDNLILKDIDLNKFLNTIIDFELSPIAKQKNIKITLKTEKIPYINADEDKIIELINNLVSNAIKYTPDGGNVYVYTKNQKSKILIEIKDTGIGINKKNIPNLFKKFYVVNKSKKSTGLGLSTCEEIIKAHNGKIGVKSTIGKGSTFWFSLPLNQKNEN